MIWIDIMYAIKQMIIYIMSAIILNALTGSCIFICFKFLEKWLEKRGLIWTSIRMLRFVILSFLVPVVFILLLNVYDDNTIFSPDRPLDYIFGVLLIIWIIGWIKAFIHSMKIHKRLKYLVNNACLCEKNVVMVKDKWEKKLKIHVNVTVKQTYTIATPIICGIIKPVILLPVNDYSKEELDVIFAHELMHCKHKDILWKQLCAFSRIVFWWNPLIRRFVYDIDSWNESYCDHAVTNILKDKKQYFTTVCRLGIQPFQKGAYLCAALYEDKNQLKTRIYRIKAVRHLNKRKMLGGVCMNVLLIVASFWTIVFITRGYHRLYMSAIMSLNTENHPEMATVEKRSMNLKEYDDIRINQKLTVVKMEERIQRGKLIYFIQTLKAKNRTESNSMYLKKGDIIKFDFLNSQNENPNKKETNFVAGIINDDGKERYVMGSDEIIHDFKIVENGNYRFFVENRYDSKTDVGINFRWEKLN